MAENMPPADFMTATGWSVNDVKNRHINGFKASDAAGGKTGIYLDLAK